MLKCGIEGHEVEGFSPIHMAANSGHYKIVSLFAEKNPELLKLKISGGENISQKYRGATILHIAVLNGFDAMINEFFKHADVKLRDCEGNTPLLLSIKERQNKITRIFLKAGDAEINTPDINCSTPLMEAVKNKSLKIVKMLLSYKVKDINCLNMNNQTALDIAHLKEDNKIVKKLKDYGAKTAKELTDLNE
jgi:ankyrin repeat protein